MENFEDYLDQAISFFSRTDTVICVFVSLVVLFATWWYVSSNSGIEIHKVEYTVKVKDDDTEKDKSTSLEEEEEKDQNFLSEEEVKKMLLDEEDMEMIKKGEKLDTQDAAAVKHYVQEMRTLSYKNKTLTEIDREREEEAKQRQLAQIFSLMNQQQEKFGETSIDDLKEQMNMYQTNR